MDVLLNEKHEKRYNSSLVCIRSTKFNTWELFKAILQESESIQHYKATLKFFTDGSIFFITLDPQVIADPLPRPNGQAHGGHGWSGRKAWARPLRGSCHKRRRLWRQCPNHCET